MCNFLQLKFIIEKLRCRIGTEQSMRLIELNPHTPVAQKVADEVVFRRFQVEMRIFWKILI